MRVNITAYSVVMAILVTGCCCFEPAVTDEDSPIVVREATLPEFNSRFIGNNPDPSFNIAMFRFPSRRAIYQMTTGLETDRGYRPPPTIHCVA